MQINESHSTDDLAGLASIIVKLNSDLNSLQKVLQQADQHIDKITEENKLLKAEVDNLKRLVIELDKAVKYDKVKEGSAKVIAFPSSASPAPSAQENPEYPDVP